MDRQKPGRGFKALSLMLIASLMLLSTSFLFESKEQSKIDGVNFVAPVREINASAMTSLQRIHADWISIIPYAYIRRNDVKVNFYRDHPRWWGEGLIGASEQIRMAKENGLKTMLKPQVWVVGEGWPGDFLPLNEEDWQVWEEDYSKYILSCARLCDSMSVDLFCFSTEFKLVVKERPDFWMKLIQDIRKIYNGPLTYAANWDNYQQVSFWHELDYIGIDAYFPLSESKTPTSNSLAASWEAVLHELEAFSKQMDKKVLFTEYGYQSRDYAARGHWNNGQAEVNMEAQSNAYLALFRNCWHRDWFAGGFLWKWFSNDTGSGGFSDRNFTPQHKPAEKVIRAYYSKSGTN